MKLALREVRRRPGEFTVATGILTLIALLLMFLGSLLDGLLGSATGAFRAQEADVMVYSANARESLVRSRITPDVRTAIAGTDGVEAHGGLGSVQLGARRADDPSARELLPTILIGYELAPRGLPAEPPALGTAVADSSLRSEGVKEGDTLLLGPQRSPIEVTGFVDDTRYAGQASLWASLDTWRSVSAVNRPDQNAGDTVQAVVVQSDGTDPSEVAAQVDAATGGATRSLTIDGAVEALPGVSQQRSTFNQIIGVTLVVALVVVGLFFSLITVERTALYGVLKAIGASSARLFGGVVTQAALVTAIASVIGIAGSLALEAAIPPGALPFDVTPVRLVASAALMLCAAVAGCALSLRRVLRIDPATAMGDAQ